MASDIEKFVASYVKRSIALSKAFEGEATKTVTGMAELHKKIINRVKRMYPNLDSAKLQSFNELVYNEIVDYYRNQVTPTVTEALEQITEKEVIWTANNLTLYAGTRFNIINSSRIAEKAMKMSFQGHTFNYWFKGSGKNSARVATELLKSGYIHGDTTDDVVRKIEGHFSKSRHEIKTLVRSSMQNTAELARDETYEEHEDAIFGYYWVSTLDHRTTPHICGIRDFKEYDKEFNPVGHKLPWDAGPGRIHFNCRSTKIPKLAEDMGDVRDDFERAAIVPGKNYEKGDNKTRTGRVRKPTKNARERELLKSRQYDGRIDYEKYLRKQKTSFIRDVLGNDVDIKAFKKGKLSLNSIAKQADTDGINKL